MLPNRTRQAPHAHFLGGMHLLVLQAVLLALPAHL
jgi:hypothetical protein